MDQMKERPRPRRNYSSNSRLIFSNPNLVCKLKKAIYGSISFDWLKHQELRRGPAFINLAGTLSDPSG